MKNTLHAETTILKKFYKMRNASQPVTRNVVNFILAIVKNANNNCSKCNFEWKENFRTSVSSRVKIKSSDR